jgi:hypothetical protein
VAEKHFNDSLYPVFAFGSAYILSSDIAFPVYNLSQYVYIPPFLEDVYLGILSAHLGNEYSQLTFQRTNHPDANKVKTTVFFILDNFNFFKPVWNLVVKYAI